MNNIILLAEKVQISKFKRKNRISKDFARDDEDVVRHECRARDSQVIGVAESPFFLVVLRVTYYVHEIAIPNMHELKHGAGQLH